jgi:UDP-perosamine 4-acetyltransferase
MLPKAVLIGAGGHARVVLDALRRAGTHEIVGALDSDPSLAGTAMDGLPILGGDGMIAALRDCGVTEAIIGVGGIGPLHVRRKLFDRFRAMGLRIATVVHPCAIVSAAATLGEGAQVLPGAIVNAGASIGENTIVNSGAIVEHGTVIGAHAHIAPGAKLAGDVTVGELSFIGIGAAVFQGLRVGAAATVAGGAVVRKPVPDGALAAGNPARILRTGGTR